MINTNYTTLNFVSEGSSKRLSVFSLVVVAKLLNANGREITHNHTRTNHSLSILVISRNHLYTG